MTDILDRVADVAMAPLTNTPLLSTDVTFEFADQAGDISRFADPGSLGYDAYVWLRAPSGIGFPNVVDADRAGVAERVRVTARNVGPQTLTVTRGAGPIDLNVAGGEYWLVAGMTAQIVEDIDDRLFDRVGADLVTDKKIDAPNAEFDALDLVASVGVAPLDFFEDPSNGTNKITMQAPAILAGDFTMTLLSVLPGVTEFLQINAAGVISTTGAVGGSLDDAYNLGSVIIADAGPVEISGAGGILLSHTEPTIDWETTDALHFNWRTTATETFDGTWEIQRGEQDADVTDDVFTPGLVLGAVNVGVRVGINALHGAETFKIVGPVGVFGCSLKLESLDPNDVVTTFLSSVGDQWQIGYDQSAAGFIIGRVGIGFDPRMFFEDTTGNIGINMPLGSLTPAAVVQLDNTSATVEAFFINQTGNETAFHVLKTTGIDRMVLFDNDGTGVTCLMNSAATDNAVLELVGIGGNARGDLNLSPRVSFPTAPDEGDIWYDFLSKRVLVRSGTTGTFITGYGATSAATEYGPLRAIVITAGVAVMDTKHQRINGEGAVADDLDTLTPPADIRVGDSILIRGNGAHTITVTDGVGNFDLDGASVALSSGGDNLGVMWDGATWLILFANQSV